MKEWYVYIARCSDGSLYTGITVDVIRRMHEHNYNNRLAASYTRSRRPVKLVHQEKYDSRSEATKREMEIKKMDRTEKTSLIDL